MKKLLGIVFCMLMVLGMMITISGSVLVEKTAQPLMTGKILYVGGSGPGNYSTIQGAIDDTVAGDTVFVYDDSSPYYENVIVDESITLLGENKETTIIDGSMNGDVVKITFNNVDFSGFSVRNSQEPDYYAGIQISSSSVSIHDCNIYNTTFGVYVTDGAHNSISYNHFENNYVGIVVTKRCSIIGNTLMNNDEGARVEGRFNEIKQNIFVNNNVGLFMDIPMSFSPFGPRTLSFNRVTNNLFQENKYVGVEVYFSNGNIIKGNNFVNNYVHADFLFCYWQRWDGNYWFPRTYVNGTCPYVIKSLFFLEHFETTWLNFDWRPAQEPNVIP
jgi:parallel beta-helix repeat protein